MGIAAGVAVALAVVAVAVSAYEGSRSTLLGQIDNSLRGITNQALHTPNGNHGQRLRRRSAICRQPVLRSRRQPGL